MNYRNKDWRNSMRVTVDYNNMMKKFVGADGFKDSEINELKEAAADAFDCVAQGRGKGMMGWTELPYNQKEIVEDILATAKEVRRKFKYFVVLGIGGSALGPIAVFNALCHLHYNDLAPSKRKGPKFYVEDNVDPERMAALLDVIEPEKTCFNVITKSGATSETMAQYLIINDMLASNPDSDYYKTPYSLRMLAGNSVPATVSVYARNFDSKKVIKQHIDNWNAQFEEGDERIIAYSDMMDMMFGMLNTMVNAVSYVLIAFTSISLVVSSVMIGIITYISVVERTKEIGVLRSLGASKFDIANVFNAETFLIGLFAGLIGIGVTYLLSIPLNLILGSLIADVGSLVILKPLHALLLVVISFVLTLIAGLIPARIASKKDPVVALRTE